MKRRYYLVCFFLLEFLILNINIKYLIASEEEDNDGIDDDFKELNKRKIEVSIEENEIVVESIKRSDEEKDEIRTRILLDEDGINIEIRYGQIYESESKSECKLEFGIIFRELIEFIDINEDGIYTPDYDENIQKKHINNFKPVQYETWSISDSSKLHYLKIQTKNNTFTLHIYFVEEFEIIENSLITPTQMKIEVEISNFDYMQENSKLTLLTRLESEEEYDEQEITEDEKNNFAEHEKGAITSFNNYTGYFTWQEKVWIDEIFDEVSVSNIITDEGTQRLYFNYPFGQHLYHSCKLGIEGLLIFKTEPFDPTFLIILILAIGALSISAAYVAYYHAKHKISPEKIEKDREEYFSEMFQEDDFNELNDDKTPLQILYEENAIEKLMQIEKINITVFSEGFFDIVNRFEWESNEKNEFIREMRALSPFERHLILEEMLKKV